jgi:hypothetical protein
VGEFVNVPLSGFGIRAMLTSKNGHGTISLSLIWNNLKRLDIFHHLHFVELNSKSPKAWIFFNARIFNSNLISLLIIGLLDFQFLYNTILVSSMCSGICSFLLLVFNLFVYSFFIRILMVCCISVFPVVMFSY